MEIEEILEEISNMEEVAPVTEEESLTVSGGDSVATYPVELVTLMEENNRLLEDVGRQLETQNMPIWEKPLSLYTVEEGMLVIILFVLLYAFVSKIVGGIICHK